MAKRILMLLAMGIFTLGMAGCASSGHAGSAPAQTGPAEKLPEQEVTVEIANYLREQAASGEQFFYDIYTEEEKRADPAKEDTGLFFFRGTPGEKFAITNAGGGFVYVAAMHDSFPHALELSKKGYNAFALIYRPGAQTACEDLARAIAFIHENMEPWKSGFSGYGGREPMPR